MLLESINIVVCTVWREENYLESTLRGLLHDYHINTNQPVCLVVGSPEVEHLETYRSLPGISVVEMGSNTWAWIKNRPAFHRASWNYYRCLTYPMAGARGTLVLEDDIIFARGWCARLDATLKHLEEQYSSNFVLSLYEAIFAMHKGEQCNRFFIEYPHEDFFGIQGIYYPAAIREDFAKYLKIHGLAGNKTYHDFLLREYLSQCGIPLFATAPCLIQHIGKTSVIKSMWHESSNFMENIA